MNGDFFQDELMVITPYRGKSAYAYAVEGGYTGSEKEFAVKLAAMMNDGIVGTVDENNNLIMTGALAAGTYTAYYELVKADGTKSLMEIGELTLVDETPEPEPEPTTFTITWVNYDATVLKTETVTEGEVPTYTGETPARADDGEYTYTFTGWTPTVVSATADATYTAVYEQTAIEPDPAEPTNFFKATPVVTSKNDGAQDAILAGGRVGSGNTYRDDSGPNDLLSNYIPVQNGDEIYMTNMKLSSLNGGFYDQLYATTALAVFNRDNTNDVITILDTDNKSFKITYSGATYLRICGSPLTDILVVSGATTVHTRYDLSQIKVNIKRNGVWL